MNKPLRVLIEHFIQAWVELFVATIWILTLGFYRPWWDYALITYFSKLELKRRLKNGEQ